MGLTYLSLRYQFKCSSCVEQFANGGAVFWVTGRFSTPPENWTVRAFLQLTPRLSNDITAAWLTFTFHLPAAFAVAATLKYIDYNVALTFILNNNNNKNVFVIKPNFDISQKKMLKIHVAVWHHKLLSSSTYYQTTQHDAIKALLVCV